MGIAKSFRRSPARKRRLAAKRAILGRSGIQLDRLPEKADRRASVGHRHGTRRRTFPGKPAPKQRRILLPQYFRRAFPIGNRRPKRTLRSFGRLQHRRSPRLGQFFPKPRRAVGKSRKKRARKKLLETRFNTHHLLLLTNNDEAAGLETFRQLLFHFPASSLPSRLSLVRIFLFQPRFPANKKSAKQNILRILHLIKPSPPRIRENDPNSFYLFSGNFQPGILFLSLLCLPAYIFVHSSAIRTITSTAFSIERTGMYS